MVLCQTKVLFKANFTLAFKANFTLALMVKFLLILLVCIGGQVSLNPYGHVPNNHNRVCFCINRLLSGYYYFNYLLHFFSILSKFTIIILLSIFIYICIYISMCVCVCVFYHSFTPSTHPISPIQQNPQLMQQNQPPME